MLLTRELLDVLESCDDAVEWYEATYNADNPPTWQQAWDACPDAYFLIYGASYFVNGPTVFRRLEALADELEREGFLLHRYQGELSPLSFIKRYGSYETRFRASRIIRAYEEEGRDHPVVERVLAFFREALDKMNESGALEEVALELGYTRG